MADTLLTDVEARARAVLARSRIYVLRELEVELDGEALVLTGEVDSYYHKQLAQELVRGEMESVKVVNHIAVVYNPHRKPPQSPWERLD